MSIFNYISNGWLRQNYIIHPTTALGFHISFIVSFECIKTPIIPTNGEILNTPREGLFSF